MHTSSELVRTGFFLFWGVWLLYIYPLSVRRKIGRRELDAFAGVASLRKTRFVAYGVLLLAVLNALYTMQTEGMFGGSIVALIVLGALATGLLIWWGIRTRNRFVIIVGILSAVMGVFGVILSVLARKPS
jgi:hypothetical protein